MGWRRGLLAGVLVAVLGGLSLPAVAVAQTAPTIREAVSTDPIPLNGTTTLTFTVTDPDQIDPDTNVSFTDALPAGLVVATPSNINDSCNPPAMDSAVSGSPTISWSDLAIPAASSCTISVDVQGVAAGTWANPVTVNSDQGSADATGQTSINVDAPPTISEVFGAASIEFGASTSLSFTITNPPGNPDTLTGVGFTDPLPTGLVVSSPNGLTGSCGGGTITADAGSGTISLSGGSLAPGDSCTFQVNVTGTDTGTQTNTTGDVTSDQGGTGGDATASIDVVDDPPTAAEAFSPADITPGESSQVAFTIGNSNPDTLNQIGFSDSLPGGLVVASPNGQTGSCGGGAISPDPGTNSITLSGASLAAGASCTFAVNVTAPSSGEYSNSTGNVTSQGIQGPDPGTGATATLTVASPPTIAEAFGTNLIGLDGTASLTFTITNPNPNPVTLTGVGFTDTLPTGLVLAGPSGAGNTCGGALSATPGSGSIVLAGGQLAAGASCTLSQSVTATSTGIVTNATGPVTSTEGGPGNTASAVLTVIGAPSVTLSAPVGGAVYAFGQKVRASYSCVDDPNGPGINLCTGTVPSGALIDTSKAGLQSFTVMAISKDGGVASDIVFYTVQPDNQVKTQRIQARPGGAVAFTLSVPGPGKITVLETAPIKSAARDAKAVPLPRGQFAFGRAQASATHATKVHLMIKPTGRGRATLISRQTLRITVWVTYTPRGGIARTTSFRVKLTSATASGASP